MNRSRWMLYGAYGYTGRLIARTAVERGHRPLLSGRDAKRLRAVAAELDLEAVEARTEELGDVLASLGPGGAVVNAAGPFTRTAAPVLEACLEHRTHYLDITAEVPVLEAIFRRGSEAREAGITVVPGVGFAVVATDSLARRLEEAVPTAVRLELAFHSGPGSSPGTVRTMIEHLPGGALRRRGGVLIRRPLGEAGKSIPFPDESRHAIPVSWGDLSTAYRTTGIPDIVTYMAMPRGRVRRLRWFAPALVTLLSIRPLGRLIVRIPALLVRGPDETRRSRRRSRIWGRVEAPDGRSAWGAIETRGGYGFTAVSAVRAVERVLEGVEAGVLTPTQAFGAGFVEEMPDTAVLGPYFGRPHHPAPGAPAR